MHVHGASLVVILIIVGNVISECVLNRNCVPPCQCVQDQENKYVCFRQSIYVDRLKACKECDQSNCPCPVKSSASEVKPLQNANEKCACTTGRKTLRICTKSENNLCTAFEDVKCQKCENIPCEDCGSFNRCQECEAEAYRAASNRCTEQATNPTPDNQAKPANAPLNTAIEPSPVPANTNRGGSGNKVGTIVGSVIGALVVVAVIVFGVYWKWGNRNRVY